MPNITFATLSESDSGRTVTRVSLYEDEKQNEWLDIRKFYKKQGQEEFLPGKGLSLPMTAESIDSLIEALGVAKEYLVSSKSANKKPKKSKSEEAVAKTAKVVAAKAASAAPTKRKVVRVGVKGKSKTSDWSD